MAAPRFASVEDYADALDPPKGETVRKVIGVILRDFPALEAKIAWNVPTVHRDGSYVAGISAAKKHLSYSAFSPAVIAAFRERLAGYVVTANLFHLPVDWNVDEMLLRDLVAARLAELG